jgi:hypothetical protein
MVERETAADVAMEDTSIGGNNCPENHARWHVTRITTNSALSTLCRTNAVCDGPSVLGRMHATFELCEVARVTGRKQFSVLDLIALVITITAPDVTKGVFSKVQSPREFSMGAAEPLRGTHVRVSTCFRVVEERSKHDQSRAYRCFLPCSRDRISRVADE